MNAGTGGYYNGKLQKVAISTKAAQKKELKYHEDTINWNPASTGVLIGTTTGSGDTPANTSFFRLPQGSTAITRVGRMAFIHEIDWNGYLRQTDFVTAITDPRAFVVKVAIMLDTQCNGSAPAYSDVMENATDTNAFPNLEYGARFKCLKCWSILLNPITNQSAAHEPIYNARYLRFSKKFKRPLALDFSGSTGVTSELSTNNVFLMCKLDGTNGATTWDGLFEVESRFRVRFTD